MLLSINHLTAQEQVVLPKFKGELNFDGICDEAAWEKIQAIKLISIGCCLH